ncbi:MAG: SDR family oxidoreductase [Alphaproteobacteria bacterium]|nr:SDR family oxidoreductase [Alphaproteobacteria bacterium]
MDLGIRGKRALLLASSGGLGFAAALALAREGVAVCVSGSDADRAQAAARRIAEETGAPAHGLAGDLADPANMDALAAAAEDALGGPVDILLVNHGGPPLRTALDVGQDELADHANRMLFSPIRIARLLVPGMAARKWGRVMMVGAAGVVEPIPNNVLSNTFRTAMAFYLKTLAGEVVGDGVTVNIVSPVAVLTERTHYTAAALGAKKGLTAAQELAAREARLPGGRFGRTEEFGAVVAFLAGQGAGYSTGANWRVDGGSVKSLG